MNIPEDRGYRGPGGYRPREDRLRPFNGMCGEDTASYPECRMSCYIGDEAECDDAKMNKHGQRISCKACKRVTLENCILTYDLDLYFMGTNLFAKDDKVVCRELGFNPNYEFSKAMHGKFVGVISEEGLISARCDGCEKRLEQCSLNVNNNCSGSIAEKS